MTFLETAGFMPHGYCLLWRPWLVALHAGADALIFASYFVIPLAILRFLRARPDVRFGALGWLFASFILLCGLTHLVGLATLWLPIYELQGILKMVTGLVSAATAAILFPLVPKLVALPSPAELEQANARLRQEIRRHEATLAELENIRSRLEETVEERTQELTETNERLTVVTRETVHRARNLLTIVQSIARQSARFAETKEDLIETLAGRMASLGRALSSVLDHGSGSADLRDVVETQLSHYLQSYPGQIEIDGPPLEIKAEAAQQIGLATHELATNAVKHGALSGSGGHVRFGWHHHDDALVLRWQESKAAPPGPRQASDGFGSLLLSRAVPTQLRGEASLGLADGGLRYELTVPLSELRPRMQSHSEADVERAFPLRA